MVLILLSMEARYFFLFREMEKSEFRVVIKQFCVILKDKFMELKVKLFQHPQY